MDNRYALTTGIASTQFGAISIAQLENIKVDAQIRYDWVQRRLIERLGPKSYAIVGSEPSWEREAWAAAADADGAGYLAGRTLCGATLLAPSLVSMRSSPTTSSSSLRATPPTPAGSDSATSSAEPS